MHDRTENGAQKKQLHRDDATPKEYGGKEVVLVVSQ